VTKRILIADDHESVLRALRAMLGANPAWKTCGDAVDWREAFARATELRPDLVILDLVMPRMDGLSAAQAISKLLPIVPIAINTLHPALPMGLHRSGGIRFVGRTCRGLWKTRSETDARCQLECPWTTRIKHLSYAAGGLPEPGIEQVRAPA